MMLIAKEELRIRKPYHRVRLLITAVTPHCSIFLAGTFSLRKNSILVEKTRSAQPQQGVAAKR